MTARTRAVNVRVTPEMIDAGAAEISCWKVDQTDDVLARLAYIAMRRVELRQRRDARRASAGAQDVRSPNEA